MSQKQLKLVNAAPKFRYCYMGGWRKRHLIPVTENTTKWALNHEATHLDALAFYRFEPDGSPAPHQWGDFYCRLMGPTGDARVSIGRILLSLDTICRFCLKMADLSPIKLTYLGERRLGMTIPSAFFGLEDGATYLGGYYAALHQQLRAWAGEFGFGDVRIDHDSTIDIENRQLIRGGHAICRTWQEFLSCYEAGHPLGLFIRHSVPAPECRERIDSEINSELKQTARQRQSARC